MHVVMDLPRELAYNAFEHTIAPLKEHCYDGLVPQSFMGNGIRFQVVETSFSPKAPHDSDLVVTGEPSSRNINQVTGFRQPVDPLQVYRDIQSGTGGAGPDGWLKSQEASEKLDELLLSWNEDDISEEDLTEEDSDSESEPGDENTGNVSENAAAYRFRASTWRRVRMLRPHPADYSQVLLIDRRDGDGPIESHRVIIDPWLEKCCPHLCEFYMDPLDEEKELAHIFDDKRREINHGHAAIHPRGTNPEQTMPIAEPNLLATEEDDFDPLEYLDYGFVWVDKPRMWETDEEIVAVGPPSLYCPIKNRFVGADKSLWAESRCRFRSPLPYQNLLRLSQLSRGVTSELGRVLYQNCTAEFPNGPHPFPAFAAERPAILPKIRGVILHLECCADFHDTVTPELAYMLSFFSPSLRGPDSPCQQKLEFLSVKLRTSLAHIPNRLPEEEEEEKRWLMDKVREWAPLFKAVDTNQLVVMLEGVWGDIPPEEGQAEWLSDDDSGDEVAQSDVTAQEILGMWKSPTTKHTEAYEDPYCPLSTPL